MTRITIDPVTRIEGHLRIDVELDDNNVVTAAYSAGMMFRGFENLLKGRDPRDPIHLTQRICGVCPVPHATAAVEAVEQAFGVTISQNARLLRNLVQGSDFIGDHLFHFYHLAALDYIQGPAIAPWTPTPTSDFRFSEAETATLVEHYVQALEIRRIAQEMGALFAGKVPHVMSFAPGGVTQHPDSARVAMFRTYLARITDFIDNVYAPDVAAVGAAYSEYFGIGQGPGNLLAYGGITLDEDGNKFFPSGIYRDGAVSEFDPAQITENVKYSWYAAGDTNKHPAKGTTTPSLNKAGAYSWLKAPRYQGEVYELGPLARMKISGDYTGGVSVMDRHVARVVEAQKMARAMPDWLDALSMDTSGYEQVNQMPASGKGAGFTEATRGALGHWLEYANGRITRYQVITPTCWNAAPRDDNGTSGALEQALVGTQMADPNQPIEIYRIVRSFDPCLGCAVHVKAADGTRVKVMER